MKKKKVISRGATTSAVIMCSVCNSQTVFSSYLAGQTVYCVQWPLVANSASAFLTELAVAPPDMTFFFFVSKSSFGTCGWEAVNDPASGFSVGPIMAFVVADEALENWVGKQAEPVRYEASIKSLNESMTVPSLASNSSWNSSWTNQPLANAATMNTPQPTVVVQSLRCDVCDIYCTSKPIYEAHIAGKKHQKKVAMQHNPSVAAGAELEIKRRKILRGGSTVDSVRVCTICNITCNSEEVYNKHLYGKKHKAQASLMALDGGPYIAAVRSQFNGIWKKDPNKVKLVQSAWCEVCKINCNSNDAYVAHLVGKKHKKNLEQLGKSKNDGSASTSNAPSAATNAIIGRTKNLGAESSTASQPQVPKEDLETKKKKVISGGATASAVRTCTVCNVVCNSHKVFSSHLAGQKHAAMVKKQAEAEVATRGPITAS
ncbi:hypothetical protein C1H46_014391 [Malus baccata]|uniref:U1-type domain-containing protein n=1 Tax=Malus baccata TaxID=106549 RepID=A0A540MP58_MALBA|nr:hypothetical protein C1H46_014391 [Malus baccata]